MIVWVYLHSIFCGGLRKTHLFWNRMRNGRSRSFKIVDFGTNRKGVCDFLLVNNSNFGSISHRFWDTASYWWKLWIFPTPLSFVTFLWGDPLWIFGRHIPCHKLESWGYQMVYISRSCFRSVRHNTGVWQTDVQTDRRTLRCRKDRASIASCR